MTVPLNYFVCTLADAVGRNVQHPRRFSTINALIDQQARERCDKPAVAFLQPSTNSYLVYTFGDLCTGSIHFANHICDRLGSEVSKRRTVALLARSTPVFLFVWLALLRTGAAVLLIAPECEVPAIAHLCRESEATTLLFDPHYTTKAEQGASAAAIDRLDLKFLDQMVHERFPYPSANDWSQTWPAATRLDVAYLHHTSGTSSGLPKLVPQTHKAAVGVLPIFDGSESATFSATPLYHGGPADCFRAWTSGALIWLFPGTTPITSNKILLNMMLSERAVQERQLPPIKYFTSVPSILKMFAAKSDGLDFLKKLDVVGVGGAALPKELGDDLVKKGVNLISRFGNAECGFLMSSARGYEQDKAWEYLRPAQNSGLLQFEPHGEGLSELIVLKQWPHLAKTNREDGSYATADLFERHPLIPDAWRYHSRADAQLTLSTGKKFDPAPVEDDIAMDPHLSHVFIFGNGRLYPGMLLWRSQHAKSLEAEDLINVVWPRVERQNSATQSHAKIQKAMILVLPADAPAPERSSKGSLLRGPVVTRYEELIDGAYDKPYGIGSSHADDRGPMSEDRLVPLLQEAVSELIGIPTGTGSMIPTNKDLFNLGIDSISATRLHNLLQCQFPKLTTMSTTLVYDCGTIDKLASFLLANDRGENFEWEDEYLLMEELVEKYGSFSPLRQDDSVNTNTVNQKSGGQVILLTGATGALGAHFLDQLLYNRKTSKVICLVRANSEFEAFERVAASMKDRKRTPISRDDPRIQCMPARIGSSYLDLPVPAFQNLLREVDFVIHAAWAVNFNTRLRSFEQDHIRGVYNLLHLVLASTKPKPPRFIFCSSTASVMASDDRQKGIPETISVRPSDASPLGYARSKWVAEAICARAAQCPRLAGRIDVIRIGQLCGDTENGVWNMKEAWPMMWRASLGLKKIPDLGEEPLRWLPVDVAAKAVLHIANRSMLDCVRPNGHAHVFHVVKQEVPEQADPTWNDAIEWMKSGFCTPSPLVKVSLPLWIKETESLGPEDPAKKLLALWKSRSEGAGRGRYDPATDDDRFDQAQTLCICPELNREGRVDFQLFGKIWDWFITTVYDQSS